MVRRTIVTTFIIIGALALTTGPASAQSTSGSVTLSVTVPPFVILHYYNAIDVTIPPEILLELLTGSAQAPGTDALALVDASGMSGNATLNGSDLELTGSVSTALGGLDLGSNNVNLTLIDSWAVRGLAPAGSSIGVTITPTSDLSNGGGSPDIGLVSGTANPATVPAGFSPTVGDTTLVLNMQTIDESGTFSGTYTITAAII